MVDIMKSAQDTRLLLEWLFYYGLEGLLVEAECVVSGIRHVSCLIKVRVADFRVAVWILECIAWEY
jgi:hypothetical protein